MTVPSNSRCPASRRPGARSNCPHVVVMGFEDGKVTHEHIYWDNASLLVQVGLIDPARSAGSGPGAGPLGCATARNR